VVGYCLAPEAIAVSIFEVLHILGVGKDQIVLRLILVVASVAWSSFGKMRIIIKYKERPLFRCDIRLV